MEDLSTHQPEPETSETVRKKRGRPRKPRPEMDALQAQKPRPEMDALQAQKPRPEMDALQAQIEQLKAALAQAVSAKAHKVEPPQPMPAPVVSEIRVQPEPRRKSKPVDSIMGDGGEYPGSIYGVTQKRDPLMLMPRSPDPVRVTCIGDSHFQPGVTHKTMRAMTLIGIHAASTKPKVLVHIGDASDMHSLCGHEKNNTWKARAKPTVRQDLDCFRENWAALNAPMEEGGHIPSIRHLTYGNHDGDWTSRFENDNPEVNGMISAEMDAIVEEPGWTHSKFREIAWIGGVGFTHHPCNIMGKAPGGQNPENTVATQTAYDTVWGHTHRHGVARKPKMDGTRVTSLNVGSSMPEFYVGDFAQNSQGEHLDYGCVDVTIFDGRIQGFNFVTMRELEDRHGRLADRYLGRV